MVGGCHLIDPEKAQKYGLKQLIYLFPLTLGELTTDKLSSHGLLTHFCAVLANFRVVRGDIGFDRYFDKLLK